MRQIFAALFLQWHAPGKTGAVARLFVTQSNIVVLHSLDLLKGEQTLRPELSDLQFA